MVSRCKFHIGEGGGGGGGEAGGGGLVGFISGANSDLK